jgi:purine nucleosidase
MGGAARTPGNVTPVAEFNIACDPIAAAEVVAAPWREPPLLVPLDVTYVATLGADELALLEERRTVAARFLAGPIAHYQVLASRHSLDGGCPAHDLLALMAVAHPELLDAPLLPLAVDTGRSAAWGATVVDFRPTAPDDGAPRWRVALDVDVAAVRARIRAMFGA